MTTQKIKDLKEAVIKDVSNCCAQDFIYLCDEALRLQAENEWLRNRNPLKDTFVTTRKN